MSLSNSNRFLRKLDPVEEKPNSPPPEASANKYIQRLQNSPVSEPKESKAKSIARDVAQPVLGAATKYTWPLALLQLAGQGEALAELDELEERIPQLMKEFPDAPWENFKGLDREKYLEAVEAAGSIFPTQANAERLIEEKTGAPLQAKTPLQKAVRLGSTAASFSPGSLSQKGTAAIVAPTVSKGLQTLGVPEGVAETVGLASTGGTPAPTFKPKVKPSGLIARRFENLKKPTQVTPARHKGIHEKLEKDFRKQADELLSKNDVHSQMKKDNLFKEKASAVFEDVERLAEEIPGDVGADEIRSAYRNRVKLRETKGISPDEFEKAFSEETKNVSKRITKGHFRPSQLVEQFRKNNASLGEIFENTKSGAANRAKKESLLDYNRSIEDVIEKKYPDSEFGKLFKESNDTWRQIMDLEQIEEFFKGSFEKGVNYKQIKDVLRRDKQHVSRPFKRILGEQGYKDFESLVGDFLTTEQAASYVKKAEAAGLSDFGKNLALLVIHPKLAGGKLIFEHGKALTQMLLDKPQLITTWKSSFDALKAGNYAAAQKGLEEVQKELTESIQGTSGKTSPK